MNFPRIIAGGRYRHRRCLDIDMDVVKVVYRGPKYLKAKVLYWNRNYNYHCHPAPQTVRIHYAGLSQWERVPSVQPR